MTVKQALAATRMLFDWLVIGQIVPTNPAGSVRGPAVALLNMIYEKARVGPYA